MRRFRGGERGAVALMLAVLLPVLLGMAALAFDIGRLMVVRNELQNAADAAALAGAGYLGQNSAAPEWALAEDRARAAVALNRADFATLAEGVVSTGYWNVRDPSQGLQPLPKAPGPDDYPAVRVNILKDEGSNGGRMRFYLAPVIGVDSSRVGASATAVMASPGSVGAGGLFPFAVTECLMKNYWDSTATPPGPAINPNTGEPWIFETSATYAAKDGKECVVGQWTTFAGVDNSVPTTLKLIREGNPEGLTVQGQTYVQPGMEAVIYEAVNQCSAAGTKDCEYVTFPVIGPEVLVKEFNPVNAFACIHILYANKKGVNKYIAFQLSSNCRTANSGGVGTNYGAKTPPRLVQ